MPVHHSRPKGASTEFLLFPIHIALVFERFIFKPEHFSKLSRVCITFSNDGKLKYGNIEKKITLV